MTENKQHPFCGLAGAPQGDPVTRVQKDCRHEHRAVQALESDPRYPLCGMASVPSVLAGVEKAWGDPVHPMSGLAGAPDVSEGGDPSMLPVAKSRRGHVLEGLQGGPRAPRSAETPQTVTKTAPEVLEMLSQAVSMAKSAPTVARHALSALVGGPSGSELGLRPDAAYIEAQGKNLDDADDAEVMQALRDLEREVEAMTKGLEHVPAEIAKILKVFQLDTADADPEERDNVIAMLKELFSSAKSLAAVEKSRAMAELAERLGGEYHSGCNALES